MIDLGSDELLRELAREAECVIAVSDFSRDDLRRRCPDSAATIHRVYNGLRPDDFPAATPGSAGPLRLVSIGRLIEFKGFHHLIEAVARLRDRHIDATLDIIGDGPWRARLTEQIDRAALADRVRLAGVLSQEQIKARLADAHVFALACCVAADGASDILPTVIMEAMATRLPVVSTQLAGVPEMVEHGVTGLLVPPADPASLADALARLAADPDLRTRFGEAGRTLCESRFSLEHTAAALAAHLANATTSAEPPAIPPPSTASVLILSDQAAEPELALLATTGGDQPLRVLAAGTTNGSAPDWLEFLPDAIVLEAAWRADPAAAATCESLYASLDSAAGESFFRDARRAVHTADLVRKRGITRIHAARAGTVLWAWLVHQLTGVRTTATIEPSPTTPRSLLARMLADFEDATVADDKVRQACPRARPDLLALAPPPRRRWFRPAAAGPAPDLTAFRRLLFDGDTAPAPRDPQTP
jgi:hypothetical protein